LEGLDVKLDGVLLQEQQFMSCEKGREYVVSLQPLETLGYDLTFFGFPPRGSNGNRFTYYTFDDTIPQRQPGHWNIVGLRQQGEEPWLLDVQLLSIDEEALDWEPFEAPRDASQLLSLKPPDVLVLIQFFEEALVDRLVLHADTIFRHFRIMEVDELHQLHLMQWQIDHYKGNFYRYIPDENAQSLQKMSVICLPQWLSQHGLYQSASLEVATFDRQRLADPQFNPFDTTEWLGEITFGQRALEEFILLLKQHTYEQFMSGSQP
jgi:hypothetical protein